MAWRVFEGAAAMVHANLAAAWLSAARRAAEDGAAAGPSERLTERAAYADRVLTDQRRAVTAALDRLATDNLAEQSR